MKKATACGRSINDQERYMDFFNTSELADITSSTASSSLRELDYGSKFRSSSASENASLRNTQAQKFNDRLTSSHNLPHDLRNSRRNELVATNLCFSPRLRKHESLATTKPNKTSTKPLENDTQNRLSGDSKYIQSPKYWANSSCANPLRDPTATRESIVVPITDTEPKFVNEERKIRDTTGRRARAVAQHVNRYRKSLNCAPKLELFPPSNSSISAEKSASGPIMRYTSLTPSTLTKQCERKELPSNLNLHVKDEQHLSQPPVEYLAEDCMSILNDMIHKLQHETSNDAVPDLQVVESTTSLPIQTPQHPTLSKPHQNLDVIPPVGGETNQNSLKPELRQSLFIQLQKALLLARINTHLAERQMEQTRTVELTLNRCLSFLKGASEINI